jgi:hypothetical protein
MQRASGEVPEARLAVENRPDDRSEIEAQLPLEIPRLIDLRGYRSESRVVDAVLRIAGLNGYECKPVSARLTIK